MAQFCFIFLPPFLLCSNTNDYITTLPMMRIVMLKRTHTETPKAATREGSQATKTPWSNDQTYESRCPLEFITHVKPANCRYSLSRQNCCEKPKPSFFEPGRPFEKFWRGRAEIARYMSMPAPAAWLSQIPVSNTPRCFLVVLWTLLPTWIIPSTILYGFSRTSFEISLSKLLLS